MSDDKPPVPVRTPTPTLDALWAKRGRGSARFEAQPLPAVGERDFALEAYDRAFDIFLGQPIPQEELDAVSKADVLAARTYPILLMRWCADYNGGFPPGQGKNEETLTLDQLAKNAEPQLAVLKPAPPEMTPAQAKDILRAENVPTVDHTPSDLPPTVKPFPPVVAPTPKPSFLSRVGHTIRAFYLTHIA